MHLVHVHHYQSDQSFPESEKAAASNEDSDWLGELFIIDSRGSIGTSGFDHGIVLNGPVLDLNRRILYT